MHRKPEWELTDNEVDELQKLIERNNFFRLKEDLTDYDIMDGDSIHITVNLRDTSKTVGGENPSHPGFNEIRSYVVELIDDDAYSQWHKDIHEYIL